MPSSAEDAVSFLAAALAASILVFSLKSLPCAAAPAANFGLRQAPRKVFVPESPVRSNATFVLTFDNPSGRVVTQAKIYGLTGAETADMTEATPTGADPVRLVWDGRDRDGSIVSSGIYIYQVQAGGILFNGTVVVAR